MLYQLPDGRTIEMSVSDFLSLSDEELQSLQGYQNIGKVINNPMYGSATKSLGRQVPDKLISEQDIPDISPEDKFNDQDYTIDEE